MRVTNPSSHNRTADPPLPGAEKSAPETRFHALCDDDDDDDRDCYRVRDGEEEEESNS